MPAERRTSTIKNRSRILSPTPRCSKRPPRANKHTRRQHQSPTPSPRIARPPFTPLQAVFEAMPELASIIREGVPEECEQEIPQHSNELDSALMEAFFGFSEGQEGYDELRDILAPTYIDWLNIYDPVQDVDVSSCDDTPQTPSRESSLDSIVSPEELPCPRATGSTSQNHISDIQVKPAFQRDGLSPAELAVGVNDVIV